MWQTIGHDKVLSTLSKSLSECRVSHAYLLTGPTRVGKMTLAMDLARALNCMRENPPCGDCSQCQRITEGLHPDIRVISLDADKTSGRLRTAITIEQVRSVQRDASLKPFEGKNKIFVFDGVGRFSEEAANSLLKTLEEPPEQVVIILLASEASDVMPTILSRCRKIDLWPVAIEIITNYLYRFHTTDRGLAEEVAGLSGGRIGWAIRATHEPEMLEITNKRLDTIGLLLSSTLEARFAYAEVLASRFSNDRIDVFEELDLWLGWWRDVMVISQQKKELIRNVSRLTALEYTAAQLSDLQAIHTVKAIVRVKSLLHRNVNARLAIEQLMLCLPQVGAV